MRAGIIGIPDYDFGPVDSTIETNNVGDETLRACLEVRNTQEDAFGGYTLQTGRAAIEELETEERISIRENAASVTAREESVTRTKYTEFALVPGEFAAVESGRGAFAFDLIGGETDVASIKRGEIDLMSFADSFEGDSRPENAQPWQVGFYGNAGGAEKGVVYGDGVFDDRDLGEVLKQCPKNQLGLIIEPEDDEEIQMTATRSGYVEVYQPSNYDALDFSEFVIEYVLPHVESRSES